MEVFNYRVIITMKKKLSKEAKKYQISQTELHFERKRGKVRENENVLVLLK